MLNLEKIQQYCLKKKFSSESFPFDDVSLVFKVRDKIFAIIALDMENQMILKCDTEYALELRSSYPDHILPARYMSKKHWNLVRAEGVDDDLLLKLIDHSYEEVVKKMPKQLRDECLG
jgi:predicted DNA-binding protein (MmcQ/YjbR family)